MPGIQTWFNIKNKIKIIHYINRLRKKNHMTISIEAIKEFDKIKNTFHDKNPK